MTTTILLYMAIAQASMMPRAIVIEINGEVPGINYGVHHYSFIANPQAQCFECVLFKNTDYVDTMYVYYKAGIVIVSRQNSVDNMFYAYGVSQLENLQLLPNNLKAQCKIVEVIY